MPDTSVPFRDYLRAKAALDTRSLHPSPWHRLVAELRSSHRPRVLEVGAGIGTMLERLFRAGALGEASYWALDAHPELLDEAGRVLETLVREFPATASGLVLYPLALDWRSFQGRSHEPFDAIIAHAFVDLVDAPNFLDSLVPLVHPGTLVYTSLIFDGVTQWYPCLLEDQPLMDRYHADMAGPVFNGERSGPRAARLLWDHGSRTGWEILGIGPSDWIVIAPATPDERLVQLWLLDTIQRVLGPEADAWVERRRAQAERGELGLRVSHLDLLLRRA